MPKRAMAPWAMVDVRMVPRFPTRLTTPRPDGSPCRLWAHAHHWSPPHPSPSLHDSRGLFTDAATDQCALGLPCALRHPVLKQYQCREPDGDIEERDEAVRETDRHRGRTRQPERGKDQDLPAFLDAERGGHREEDEADERAERLDADRGDHVVFEAQPAEQKKDLER